MSKSKLHPGARWIFRINGYAGGITAAIATVYLLGFGLAAGVFLSDMATFQKGIMLSVTSIVALIILFGEIYARMTYNRWFYEFTESSIKLERGIIWKRYSNIPYERIQNIDVTRGIIARLFNFSTVDIQTAGYTGAQGTKSEGHIPGVSINHAEEIRDFITKTISHKKGQFHQGI